MEHGALKSSARRGRIVAIGAAAVALVVLVVAVFSAWSRLREQWYLRQLEQGNTQERLAAMAELESMPSLRAIPKLVAMLYREDLQPSGENSEVSMDGRAAVGLIKIGRPVIPILAKALNGPDATQELRLHSINIFAAMPWSGEAFGQLDALTVNSDQKVSTAAKKAVMRPIGAKNEASR